MPSQVLSSLAVQSLPLITFVRPLSPSLLVDGHNSFLSSPLLGSSSICEVMSVTSGELISRIVLEESDKTYDFSFREGDETCDFSFQGFDRFLLFDELESPSESELEDAMTASLWL
ncbi:hypothetical protein LWI28_006079 [Acer negundo]|uniref:Uncharacterized protein n=1 Tax=Acer negundo TaxID=4023 RepID=A0AAD5I8M5_ACENE|nr:hypothetical protein LWI28_006079 [Acer negundo]